MLVIRLLKCPVEEVRSLPNVESQKENTEGCCIKHLSPDYIFKLKGNHGIHDREGEVFIHVYG